MDKKVTLASLSVTTAADTNWVQGAYLLLDNSSNTVERTVKSLGVKCTAFVSPSSANQKSMMYYTMVFVTNTDGVLPSFAGTEAALNVALDKYRKNIWLTDSGFCRADSGREAGVVIEYDPSTSRKLMPGQKLYFVVMAVFQDSGAAAICTLSTVLDQVLFFD